MEATIEPEIEQRRKSVLGRRSLLSAAANGPLPEVHLPFALKLYSSKRFLDVMLAVPLLILSLPLMFLCGIWIKLVSLGPVIYTQVRLGLKGKPYTIYKLRTMLVDCEKATGPIWSPADDRRIIWGGQFLRRWHLDELPQLWNVIIGDMSLIGPRPERPEIILELQKDIPEVTPRLAVRPGITGLAQVTLPPDNTVLAFRRKTELDLQYIREGCLDLDLQILTWTFLKEMGLRQNWIYPRVQHG